jgi:2-iminobutanoate/2-iminopropanoate deaminase
MAKEQITTTGAPAPIGPFSQALRVGDLIFVSGQGPIHPVTGEMADTIEDQTRQTLENIGAILAAAGAKFDDIVKCTVWLRDLSTFERYNAVYETFFSDPKPTRATVGADLLGGIGIEIDAVAHVA